MPKNNRAMNEIIMPADANMWDLASDQAAAAIPKTDFMRAHGATTTGGSGAAFTANVSNFTLADMNGLTVKLHADMQYGATINANGLGAKGIYTSNGQLVLPQVKAGAIVTLIYNLANDRFYLLGAGSGGDVTAVTGGTSTALTATSSGYVLSDMRSISLKLHTDIGQSATININGVGAKGIFTCTGQPVHDKAAIAGSIVLLAYNQAQDRFYVLGMAETTGSTTIIDSAIRRERWTGDGLQTVFDFTNGRYALGGNRLLVVSAGGMIRYLGVDYTETSPTAITFSEAPPDGAIVEVNYIENFYGDTIDAGEF